MDFHNVFVIYISEVEESIVGIEYLIVDVLVTRAWNAYILIPRCFRFTTGTI